MEGVRSWAAAEAKPWDEKAEVAPSEAAPAIPAVAEGASASVAGHLHTDETVRQKPWRPQQ